MLNLVGEAEEETELRTLAKDWNTETLPGQAERVTGGDADSFISNIKSNFSFLHI